tara:strand:+ start:1414 stop:2097 length:684 start_codon:yes stop_codon:yes gene_type:complete
LWLGQSAIEDQLLSEPRAISPTTHQAIIGATSRSGADWITKMANSQGLIEGEQLSLITDEDSLEFSGRLTLDGWARYESLVEGSVTQKKAFMAMQYGDPELDEIVDKYFRDAVRETGFDLVRLDDNPAAGLIDDRLRVEIRTSRFVIADLTHGNQGAYWEAGFAEGIGRPIIYTCKKQIFDDPDTRPHFDTNHHHTILWDKDDLGTAIAELQNTIRATLPAEAKMEA